MDFFCGVPGPSNVVNVWVWSSDCLGFYIDSWRVQVMYRVYEV